MYLSYSTRSNVTWLGVFLKNVGFDKKILRQTIVCTVELAKNILIKVIYVKYNFKSMEIPVFITVYYESSWNKRVEHFFKVYNSKSIDLAPS